MDLLLNFGFAWIAIILTFVLSIKYFVRKGAQTKGKNKAIFVKYNKILKNSHIYIGIILILAGFIHGFFSTQSVFSLNLGTICWILTILLGLNYSIRKKLNKIKPWIIVHRILTVMMIFTLFWHVIDVGGIQVLNVAFSKDKVIYEAIATTDNVSTSNSGGAITSKSNSSSNTLANFNNSFGTDVILKDGSYTGVAHGFGPNLTISVEIKGNKLTKITVVSHNERDSKYYTKPIQLIPQEIVSAQSLDVDTVSRATMTSVGIINAVNNALSKALISGTLPQMKTLPTSKKLM